MKKYKYYVKKPIPVLAIQVTEENLKDIKEICKDAFIKDLYVDNLFHIQTIDGVPQSCHYGDYIVRGVKGEFYPCKKDIFESTYTFQFSLDEKKEE